MIRAATAYVVLDDDTGALREVGTVEVDVEETRPGYITSKLKEADQVSGQTFNDVGHLDDEGKVRIEVVDRQVKM